MNKHAPHALDPSWSAPTAAVAFLQQLRAHGPWNLTAIVPDVAGAESITLDDPARVEDWVAARVAKANLYYAPNPAPRPTGYAGRATKSDVRAFEYAHVDIDLDKLPPEHPLAALPLADRKARTVDALQHFASPGAPSFIVDSGGGVQALWRIDPAPTFTEQYPAGHFERINAQLIDLLGGDPGTHNVDRLLRLPGTPNLPDAKKRQRGRVPAPAVLVASTASTYADFLFDLSAPRTKPDSVDVEFGPPDDDIDLDALAAEYQLPRRLVEIVRQGRLPDPKAGDDSRSAWLFDAVCGLVRAGVPNETILGIIRDPALGIAESVIERGDDAERYSEHCLRGALAAVAKESADSFDEAFNDSADTGTRRLRLSPYVSRDPSTIEPRQWVYPPAYIRKFTTGTLAHGGVGKSTLLTAEALAMASGLPLLGVQPKGRLRVMIWNGEDPYDELARKVEAARKRFKLRPADLDGWLFMDSGRDLPITIATQDATGTRVATPQVLALIAALREAQIDVLIIDPFVASHGVNENDNGAIEQVARAWNRIAEEANCAVHLAHHAVKARGRDAEGMDFRGGGAALAKLRYLRVLNPMQAKDAPKHGISPQQASLYFRADTGKGNLSPPSAEQTWYQLASVDLGNSPEFGVDGDLVGVVQRWAPPEVALDPTHEQLVAIYELLGDKVWRMSMRGGVDWVAVPIAKVLGLDTEDAGDRKNLQGLIDGWEASGFLAIRKPTKSDASGNKRPGYVRGKLPPNYEEDDN